MNNQTISRSEKFFYGWLIVAVSTLALLVSNGLAIGGLPVFYKPIQEDLLKIGTVAVNTKDSITGFGAGLTFLLSGIFSLLIGLLVDKVRLKTLMIIGCFVLGGALILYSQATSPWQIYLSHSLLGLSLGLVGVLPQTVLISRWFRRKRGLAMGIVLTGTSLGGTLISLAARPLVQDYGWRAAMLWLSLIVWFVLLPAILFLVREKASDLGLNFDGDWQSAGNNRLEEKAASNSETGHSFVEALTTPTFWILSLCAAAVFYPIFTVYQQFILYIQSPQIGADASLAGYAQSTIGITAVGGKFLFGWLSDYLSTTRVMLICCSLMFLSTIFLLGFLSAGTIFVFLIPFGLGYGGTFVLIQLLAVESFGLRDIGKILGALTVIETFGGFVGSVVTGRLASANNGDYTTAFYGVTIASGLALLMTFALFLVKRKQKSSASIIE